MTSDAGQLNSAVEQKGKQDDPCKLNNPLLSFQICFTIFLLFSRREGGRGTVGDHVEKCRLHKSDHDSFIAPMV
jgi:hypothetical protein